MKILIVTDAWEPQVNGVVRTIQATNRELERMGHEVVMITPLSFKTMPCPTYPEIRLSLFPSRRVAQMMAQMQPDAVHIATEGPLGLAARRYLIKNKLPFTTAYHTRFPEYVKVRFGIPLAWSYRFLRWFHDPAQHMLAPTPAVIRDLESYGFSNVAQWTRGVDTELFYPRDTQVLNTDLPIYLYVGRVAIEKNIDAFLQLDLQGSKWVVGEGPELARLKKQYPDVHFLGVLTQDELAQVYSSADVFVFPSLTDTFGLVLLEALACGTPVAAYPVTGPLDVLGDADAGVMDEHLLNACIMALGIAPEKARAHAERFSWGSCTREFVGFHGVQQVAREKCVSERDVEELRCAAHI